MAAARGFDRVLLVARTVEVAGGRALLAGGCVRDMLLERVPKDFDVEVYGLTAEHLERLARDHGRVNAVGKAFGILKLTPRDGVELDLSLPRRDSKIGAGHRGFLVKTDPSMSYADACRRRDFTLNAMLGDPLTGEVIDPYHGRADLDLRLLRVTDAERFADDPLRVMRGVQLAARFALRVDAESLAVMRGMLPHLSELPHERMWEEWKKLLAAHRPSTGLLLAREAGVLAALYPALHALAGASVPPHLPGDGDAWQRTLTAVDRISDLLAPTPPTSTRTQEAAPPFSPRTRGEREALSGADGPAPAPRAGRAGVGASPSPHAGPAEEKDFLLPLRLAALCALLSPADAAELLRQIGADQGLRGRAMALVEQVGWPAAGPDRDLSDGRVRRLAATLSPATVRELILLLTALAAEPRLVAALAERAAALEVLDGPPRPVLRGQDLIDLLGLAPGPAFRHILALADDLRDDAGWTREQVLDLLGGVADAETALVRLRAAQEDRAQ